MSLKQVRKLSKKERQFYKKIDTLFISLMKFQWYALTC
jgi:hypothetical protein